MRSSSAGMSSAAAAVRGGFGEGAGGHAGGGLRSRLDHAAGPAGSVIDRPSSVSGLDEAPVEGDPDHHRRDRRQRQVGELIGHPDQLRGQSMGGQCSAPALAAVCAARRRRRGIRHPPGPRPRRRRGRNRCRGRPRTPGRRPAPAPAAPSRRAVARSCASSPAASPSPGRPAPASRSSTAARLTSSAISSVPAGSALDPGHVGRDRIDEAFVLLRAGAEQLRHPAREHRAGDPDRREHHHRTHHVPEEEGRAAATAARPGRTP